MTLTIEATYENGMLKLDGPLPLKERERVRVTVQPETTGSTPTQRPDDSSAPTDESSDFAEWEMVDIRLNVPPSPAAITVVARRAEILPSPYKIDESDLAPE